VLGEAIAWVVGWSLILEYSLVVSTVAVGWSGYFVGFLEWLQTNFGWNVTLPAALAAGPHAGGVLNVPAIVITFAVAGLLIAGTRESATLNAILSYLMMRIVGIPYAAVLAVTVGLLGLIPMIGATLGAAVVCLVAFFDEPKKALIALVYYLVYQQLENYVVYPRVMSSAVEIPGAVTVIAALIGAALLGVVGALLAIPTAAAILLLIREIFVRRQDTR
jgi:amino acid transporter